MRRTFAAWTAVAACQPPPPVELGGEDPVAPAIEILYPEPAQEIVLDATCTLTEPLIVHVEGLDLVATGPDPEDIPGEGHWHGGPSLSRGYCVSSVAFCVGDATGEGFTTYDGSGMAPGSLTLYVELQSNVHARLGPTDQVEVRLIDPDDHCRAAE